MLSESSEKHRERLTNLQETLVRRPALSLADLVRAERMPQPHLRDAFYGQSVALTSLLIRKSTPAKFADFIEESRTDSTSLAPVMPAAPNMFRTAITKTLTNFSPT